MLTASDIHEVAGHLVTGDEVAAMRFWIADCVWVDLDVDDAADLSHAQVVAGVDRHYEGGVRAFLDTLQSELAHA